MTKPGPKKGSGNKVKTNFSLDKKLVEKLKEKSIKTKIPMSQILEVALKNYLN